VPTPGESVPNVVGLALAETVKMVGATEVKQCFTVLIVSIIGLVLNQFQPVLDVTPIFGVPFDLIVCGRRSPNAGDKHLVMCLNSP